jgi:hypothetical protein
MDLSPVLDGTSLLAIVVRQLIGISSPRLVVNTVYAGVQAYHIWTAMLILTSESMSAP